MPKDIHCIEAPDLEHLVASLRSFSNPDLQPWSTTTQCNAHFRMKDAADTLDQIVLGADAGGITPERWLAEAPAPTAQPTTNPQPVTPYPGPFSSFGGELALVIGSAAAPGRGYRFRAGDPSPSGRIVGYLSMPDEDTFDIRFIGPDDEDALGWDPARLRKVAHGRQEERNHWKGRAKINEAKAHRFKRALHKALDTMVRRDIDNIENGLDVGPTNTKESK